MGTMVLWAIGIDDLRDAFSGTDAAVARLREVALATWPPTPPPARRVGLLDKLGPFARRAVGEPAIRPDVPTGRDLDDVAHGRDVPADRLDAAWALVEAFLAATALGRLEVDLSEREIDDLDYRLSVAGAPAEFGLRPAFTASPGIPLKPLPGLVTGYVRGGHAAAMASVWASVLDGLPADQRPAASRISAWLDRFPGWARAAEEAGRPAPDLLVTFRS